MLSPKGLIAPIREGGKKRIFSCDIDKVLLEQNYVKSHVISQVNLTMRLNQREAFYFRMVGKILVLFIA